MATTKIREKRKSQLREKLTNKLEELDKQNQLEYQKRVEEFNKQKEAEQIHSAQLETINYQNLAEDQETKTSNKEELQMSRAINFKEELENTGVEKVNLGEIPSIQDDAGEVEVKQNAATDATAKESTGKFDGDLEEIAKQNISNFAQIQEKSKNIANLLRQNLFIKQFITTGDFGRGMAMAITKPKDGTDEDKVAHFKVEQIKPGRAKSVIVTMPKVIADVLQSTAKKSAKGVKEALINNLSGDLTPEQKADTVDVVMGYDELMVRVANLMEGQIAEFGGVNGELSFKGDGIKVAPKKDVSTNKTEFATTSLVDNQVKEMIGGKEHIIYTMKLVDAGILGKAAQGEALSEKEKKAVTTYKTGKAPLKRTKGAFSALYTPTNYTPTVQYETVKPFGQITKDEAERLSAKAVFKAKANTSVRVESYDAAMVKDDILQVFDPSVKADDRYEMLTVAKNFVRTDKNGNPVMRKVPDIDENGNRRKDANGKNAWKEIADTATDQVLTDRVPRDYFTGAPVDKANLAEIEFVKYGVPGLSKDNKATMPKAQKKRISFEGCEATVKEGAGIVGTYDLTDKSVEGVLKLASEATVKDAFIAATTRTSKGKSNNVANEYEDGLIAALLESANF